MTLSRGASSQMSMYVPVNLCASLWCTIYEFIFWIQATCIALSCKVICISFSFYACIHAHMSAYNILLQHKKQKFLNEKFIGKKKNRFTPFSLSTKCKSITSCMVAVQWRPPDFRFRLTGSMKSWKLRLSFCKPINDIMSYILTVSLLLELLTGRIAVSLFWHAVRF